MQEQWLQITENLKKILSPGDFKVWIESMEAHCENSELTLCAPNNFMATVVNERFKNLIFQAAEPVLGKGLSIQIKAKLAPPEPKKAPEQVALPIKIAPPRRTKEKWRYSFEDFVVGNSNSMAVAAAQDLCIPDGDIQTLFVNASGGLGKTHLTQAIGHAIWKNRLDLNVLYLTAENFASQFIAALRNHNIEQFRERMQKADLLLLEDVHFLQGKPKIQETALNIVKDIQEHSGRVVFTSSFAPRDLRKIDSHLYSYFCSGIIASIFRPDAEMRGEILQRKAKELAVNLPDTVCELLANKLPGDIRQIESCLKSLVFKASVLHQRISVDLAQDLLAEYVRDEVEAGDPSLLIRQVCEIYGLDLHTLKQRSRKQAHVIGRNTLYYLIRKHTELTLQEIGKLFNRRHSTVLQGITTVEREIARSSGLGRQIENTILLVERRAGLEMNKEDLKRPPVQV